MHGHQVSFSNRRIFVAPFFFSRGCVVATYEVFPGTKHAGLVAQTGTVDLVGLEQLGAINPLYRRWLWDCWLDLFAMYIVALPHIYIIVLGSLPLRN